MSRAKDSTSPVVVASAPGRLDVMGGIADYSGALVLQLPLDRRTTVRLERMTAPRCEISSSRSGNAAATFSMDLEPIVDGALRNPTDLARAMAGRPQAHWASYVLGVVQYCLQRAHPPIRDLVAPGLRLHIDSTVPQGKGVSSSAALEVATMMAVSESYHVPLAAEQVAIASQWVENVVVGAPCGIMDQMTSACGKRGKLLRLKCQPGTIEGYVDIPRGYRFYGIDSGVRHAVTGADYGTVRTAAFMGYRIMADIAGLRVEPDGDRVMVDDPLWHGYLANVSPQEFESQYSHRLPTILRGDDFLARYGGTTDAVTRVDPARSYPVRAATTHPIYEQQRVSRFAEHLDSLKSIVERENTGGNAQTGAALLGELGALMYASHASYGACGLGSEGTDRLVEMVRTAGPEHGLFGAKITGGGSGGTVAILGTVEAERVVRAIADRYAEVTGREAEVFSESSEGAAEAGVGFG